MTETMVMIHGMWGGSWCWQNCVKYFENRGFHCLTPTLRYHDMPPDAPPDPALGNTRLLDYVADLEKEIRTLPSPPIIVGHSMGGLLAQILAARGLAKALVLLTPAPPAGIWVFNPSAMKSFLSALLRWKFWQKPTCQTFRIASRHLLNLLPAQKQQEIFEKLVCDSGRAAFEIGFWFLDSTQASRVDASKIDCPVLVIAGSEDRILPPSIVRKVARKYQAACTYKEFSDHAHWLIGEPGWEEVAAFIVDWLVEKQLYPPCA